MDVGGVLNWAGGAEGQAAPTTPPSLRSLRICIGEAQERGCQRALTRKWTVDEQRAGMRAAETPRRLSAHRRGPDVPLPARAHLSALRLPLSGTPALRSSPLPPRLSCTPAGAEMVEGGASRLSRLSPACRFDVSSVIASGLRQRSLEGFDMKSGLSSQVYATASDPGLKQSPGRCGILLPASDSPHIGASSAMKDTFPAPLSPSCGHILGVLIELG